LWNLFKLFLLWFPYFFAISRKGESFQEAYDNGIISHTAKRIYDIICGNGAIAFHEIKQLGCFTKEDKSKFERAIVELQMSMFITMCGRVQKTNKYGEGYGWNSTIFTTVENFWQKRGVYIPDINEQEAIKKINSDRYKKRETHMWLNLVNE